MQLGGLRVQDLGRVREILRVLSRHGLARVLADTALGELVPEDSAPEPNEHWTVRVRKALVELGPAFVKLGQVLSVRPDIVPVALARELQLLLDRVDPVDTTLVRRVIEEELGAQIEDLFDCFSDEPLAAASLAQVHRARLRDGTPVAIKVQRPDILPVIQSDVRILYALARLLEGEIELPGMRSLPDIISEFETALYQELDFIAEARACERFRSLMAESQPALTVPRTFPRYSSRRVLVMELVEGEPASVLGPDDPRAKPFARALIAATYTQVFEAGFFHGDPHPGNLLVRPDGGLVYLDFGLTGTLTAAMQRTLSSVFTSLVFRDAESLALAVYRAGATEGRVDLRAFRREVELLMEKYNGASLQDFAERENLLEIIEVAARHRITLPREFAVLGRAVALVYGLAQRLLPDVDIFEEVRPYAQKLALREVDPQRLASEATRLLLHARAEASELPLQLDQLLQDLEAGRLQLNARDPEAEAMRLVIHRTGVRVSLALCASGLAVAGAVMLAPLDLRPLGVPLVPLMGLLTLVGGTAVWAWLVAHTHFADHVEPRKLLRAALLALWGLGRRLRGRRRGMRMKREVQESRFPPNPSQGGPSP